jgi:hypothetical protein
MVGLGYRLNRSINRLSLHHTKGISNPIKMTLELIDFMVHCFVLEAEIISLSLDNIDLLAMSDLKLCNLSLVRLKLV